MIGNPIGYPIGGVVAVDTGTFLLSIATETDSAFAIPPLRKRAIGLATETDSAFAARPLRTRAIGLTSETDGALSANPFKSRLYINIGLASEADGDRKSVV